MARHASRRRSGRSNAKSDGKSDVSQRAEVSMRRDGFGWMAALAYGSAGLLTFPSRASASAFHSRAGFPRHSRSYFQRTPKATESARYGDALIRSAQSLFKNKSQSHRSGQKLLARSAE